MTTKDPKDVVAEFDRAGEEGDVEALKAVCHPQMLTHSFGPSMPQGIEGVRKFVAKRASSGAGGRWGHLVTVAQGEYVTQFGVRVQDWPGGPFRGFDVPAGTITRDSAFMFRVRDGLITDRWAIRDDLAMMVQLGAVQAPRPEQVHHGTVTSWREQPFEMTTVHHQTDTRSRWPSGGGPKSHSDPRLTAASRPS